jgi:N utilization substance protein A
MNRELIHIVEQMSKERGIPKESILETLESALLSAVRKKYGLEPEINIKIDEESGEISMTAVKKDCAGKFWKDCCSDSQTGAFPASKGS